MLVSIQSYSICHNDPVFTGPGNPETLSLFSKAAAEGGGVGGKQVSSGEGRGAWQRLCFSASVPLGGPDEVRVLLSTITQAWDQEKW